MESTKTKPIADELGHGMFDVFEKTADTPLLKENLPQFLQEYLNIVNDITDAQEGAKLTAILPAMAVNIGNRVYISNSANRIFPNIWSVVIGPSTTSRKTTVINLAKKTLQIQEEINYQKNDSEYANETLVLSNTTGTKLLSLLAKQPNRLFVHNEISGFLAEMSKLYNSGMKQTITDLYDGISRTHFTLDRQERIKDPSLSILSASTEGWFLSMIGNQQEQLSGFTQRFLYCIIRNIDIDSLNTDYREGYEQADALNRFDEMYQVMQSIPGSFRLKLSPEAISYRNQIFKDKLKAVQNMKNDSLISYFSRIYDGYFFKFCILFTMYDHWKQLKACIEEGACSEFFEAYTVSEATARQAFYLCDYYYENTIPLLKILTEQGKLSQERKFVNLLNERFGGKASHSEIMQYGHFTAKDMKTVVETLLEMNVIEMENINNGKGKKAFQYVLNPVFQKQVSETE